MLDHHESDSQTSVYKVMCKADILTLLCSSVSLYLPRTYCSTDIPRGYEMIYSWDSASSSYTFAGRPCTSSNQICAVGMMDDGNLYSNRCSGYGVIDTAYGLKVRPCKWCQGPVSKIADLDLGFSVCSEYLPRRACC